MNSAGAFVYIIRSISWGCYLLFTGFVIIAVGLKIVFIPAIVEISVPPLIHQPDLRNSVYLLPWQ